MKPQQRGRWVAGLLLCAWLLVVAWQVDEHRRVVAAAQADLRVRSREIARDLSAVTHALRIRGAVFQERLVPVLNDLVHTPTNETSRLLAVSLLNTDGDPVVAEGETNLLSHEVLAEREDWSANYVTFMMTVEGASVNSDGVTNNPTVVLPSFRNFTNSFTNGEPRERNRDFFRDGPRPAGTNFIADDHWPPPGPPPMMTNAAGEFMPPPPPPAGGERPRGGPGRRPSWMRWMSESDYKALVAKRELHGLVLVVSTEDYRATCIHDLWLRYIIAFFAGISAIGVMLAWRNTARTAELQIRLVRASELNSHLKEMNLAAAGLAHETRNPLNIIRGLAQMVSRLPDASPEVRTQSKTIVDETDKVTAQLTEFINYSRPREVRRTRIVLAAAAAEIVRTLNFDIEEKKLKVETGGEPLAIEADEQLLRQVLFNLLLNAIQAVSEGGHIKIEVRRVTATEALLEMRDDGYGVTPENRMEIFKPYFTTHQKGTGLGLAVVSQIVLAHGWEIQCLPNEPRGAIFRITHLKIAA
jgi:signal transduction histidine kinase